VSPKRFCILFLIAFVFTANISHATRGKIGAMADLDSDSIVLITDKPIRNVHVIFKVDGDPKDIDILLFIQAFKIELFRKKFNLLGKPEKSDVKLSLRIKKIEKDYWTGLAVIFSQQRQVECLSVKTLYETVVGKWNKEFIAHKGYWTYTGDSYYRNTTTNDLSRAIVNPLHNYTKEKAFIRAAGSGNFNAVRAYIGEHINIDADNDSGDTALITASNNKRGEIVRLLISLNVDMDIKNYKGWSALTHTAYNGDEETTVLLLNGGARVNTEDYENRTPLDWAVMKGHMSTAMLIKGELFVSVVYFCRI